MTKEFKFNNDKVFLLKDCLMQERIETSKYTLEKLTKYINQASKLDAVETDERMRIYHDVKDVIDYSFKRTSGINNLLDKLHSE